MVNLRNTPNNNSFRLLLTPFSPYYVCISGVISTNRIVCSVFSGNPGIYCCLNQCNGRFRWNNVLGEDTEFSQKFSMENMDFQEPMEFPKANLSFPETWLIETNTRCFRVSRSTDIDWHTEQIYISSKYFHESCDEAVIAPLLNVTNTKSSQKMYSPDKNCIDSRYSKIYIQIDAHISYSDSTKNPIFPSKYLNPSEYSTKSGTLRVAHSIKLLYACWQCIHAYKHCQVDDIIYVSPAQQIKMPSHRQRSNWVLCMYYLCAWWSGMVCCGKST